MSYATATPVTGSGAVSTPGDDYLFMGIVLALTSTGNNDYVSVLVYDGTDNTGVLVGAAEAWEESTDHHRVGVVNAAGGTACTDGMYVEVATESAATYKCTILWR